MLSSIRLVLPILSLLSIALPVRSFSSYPNEFIRVNYTMDGNWNQSTIPAQKTVVAAAQWWAAQGPWCEFIPSTPFF